MINEHIESKYSFKIHPAYIVDVKRNLELPLNDAPNTVKKLKQSRKHPTVDKIEATCENVYPKFKKYGVTYPQLKFRNMVSRWGSCQPKRGSLTFNISLVEAPMSCIEYVVTHEFTHFLHPNHSKNFYQTLSMFMPDWQDRKNILERNNTYLY